MLRRNQQYKQGRIGLPPPEGKAYDEQPGTEFVQKHLAPLRQCKQNAGDDLRSFWILLKLDKDGTVKEVLLYPATKLGTCAREPNSVVMPVFFTHRNHTPMRHFTNHILKLDSRVIDAKLFVKALFHITQNPLAD
jgi:hypothetical protein